MVELTPVSGDFVVGSDGLGAFDGRITALSDGRFVLVWANGVSAGNSISGIADTDTSAVIGQFVNSDGSLDGSPFQINSTEVGGQGTPDITALKNGGFVVSWTDAPSNGVSNVRGQVFDGAGAAVGGQITLSSVTTDVQQGARVVALADGGFVALWQDARATGSFDQDIRGQFFSASGSKIGQDFLVLDGGSADLDDLSVTVLSNGHLRIVANEQIWRSSGSTTNGGSQLVVSSVADHSGIFDAGFATDIAAMSSGRYGMVGLTDQTIIPGFVVALYVHDAGAGDGAVAPAGGGTLIRVSDSFQTAAEAGSVKVTALGLSDGGLVVVWAHRCANSIGFDLYAQVFDADLNRVGGNVLVQENATGDQSAPFVAQQASGQILIGWTGPDGAGNSVALMGRLFNAAASPPPSDGDDTITGTVGDDDIDLGGGDDVYTGLGGDDTAFGGLGDDDLDGGDGTDTLYGGVGHDTLTGGTGDDVLYGGDTTTDPGDTLFGGLGDDTIDGGYGPDLAYGGDGHDSILGGVGVDTLYGGLGDDSLGGGTGDDLLYGDDGRDTLSGGVGNDTVFGGLGDDILTGGTGDDSLSGGVGGDTVYGGNGTDILDGGDGDDVLFGGETSSDLADTMYGGAGTDRLEGGYGDDALYGGVGNDSLAGGFGDDLLLGQAGDDTLLGGSGDDRLIGDAGADTLYGGDGGDLLNGGDGDDFIFGGLTSADVRDTIYAGAGNDVIDGGYGNDLIFGQDGNDQIAGGFGSDTLQGQGGNDVITGSALSDLVFGNDGDDFVNGGFGHDRINGGSGADKFYHLGIRDHGGDWIQDFSNADGDVLVFGTPGASKADFKINYTHTANEMGERSGDDTVKEAFVVYLPRAGIDGDSGIVWALVDGADLTSLVVEIAGGGEFDLLG